MVTAVKSVSTGLPKYGETAFVPEGPWSPETRKGTFVARWEMSPSAVIPGEPLPHGR